MMNKKLCWPWKDTAHRELSQQIMMIYLVGAKQPDAIKSSREKVDQIFT